MATDFSDINAGGIELSSDTLIYSYFPGAVTPQLYVCTFRKGGSRKEHHVVSRVRINNLVATEVSDAYPHYMPG